MDYSSQILPSFTLPGASIEYSKPNEEITEKEKFEDGGKFFEQMNRWIALNFFNPFRPRFYDNEKITQRVCDTMSENWAYYYGHQQNNTFNASAMINENDTIQAVYVPDQKIRQLVDHGVGNCIKMIQPIKDSLSAKVLSYDKIKETDGLKKKLQTKKDLDKIMPNDSGVTFAPAGIEAIGDDDDIDDIMDKFKEKEELKFVKLAQHIYYKNGLGKKYEQSALHEFVNNVSTFFADVENNDTEVNFFPSNNSIVDTRATDDYLSDAELSGFVQFLTPAEIFDKWGTWLDDDQKMHINNMSQKKYSNWQECYNYYNLGCPNYIPWDSETGKVSCVTTFWIGKKDLRYSLSENQYGKKKRKFIDDNADYNVFEDGKATLDENGKGITEKGSEKKGDKESWFVHKSTTIGNYACVGYGYHPIHIRQNGKKQKPLLPTIQFVHRLNMGYARSVVSRLRHFSDEKGRLKLKIQELTGQDMGKLSVLYADKMGLTEDTAKEMFKDFKTMGFSIIGRTGEVGEDNRGMAADTIDRSLQPTITAYVDLCRVQDAEMEAIVSTPAVSLGQQQSTIGKGVQSQTITQATLGQLSLYDGLMEHYRQVLAYALNVAKTLKAGKEEMIQTGDNEAYLLNITKDETYENIGLYILPSDVIEEKNRETLTNALFAYNQNPQTGLGALINTLKIMGANSYEESINKLEKYQQKQEKKEIATQQMQGQQETQQQMALIAAEKAFTVKMKEMELLIKSSDTRYVADVSSLTKIVTGMESQNTQILQLLLKQQAEEAVVTPIQQEVAANEAAAQEQPVQ